MLSMCQRLGRRPGFGFTLHWGLQSLGFRVEDVGVRQGLSFRIRHVDHIYPVRSSCGNKCLRDLSFLSQAPSGAKKRSARLGGRTSRTSAGTVEALIHTCIDTYIHAYSYIHTSKHPYMHISMHPCIHACTRTCARTTTHIKRNLTWT